jgi:hypothetical protein
MTIEVKMLDTGYYRAQGNGPCEWAQWPVGEDLAEEHFFPEASRSFRSALRTAIASRGTMSTWRRTLTGHRRAHLFGGIGRTLSLCGKVLAQQTVPLTVDELTAHGQPSIGAVCSQCASMWKREK